jgi:hypothetical protein
MSLCGKFEDPCKESFVDFKFKVIFWAFRRFRQQKVTLRCLSHLKAASTKDVTTDSWKTLEFFVGCIPESGYEHF